MSVTIHARVAPASGLIFCFLFFAVGTASHAGMPKDGSVVLNFSEMPHITNNAYMPPSLALAINMSDDGIECRTGVVATILVQVAQNPMQEIAMTTYVGEEAANTVVNNKNCQLLKELKITLPFPNSLNPRSAPIFGSDGTDRFGGQWEYVKLISISEAQKRQGSLPAANINRNQVVAMPNFLGYRVKFKDGKVTEVSPLLSKTQLNLAQTQETVNSIISRVSKSIGFDP